MPVAVSRVKKADSSPARGAPDLGGSSLDSARQGEFNGIRLEAVACL